MKMQGLQNSLFLRLFLFFVVLFCFVLIFFLLSFHSVSFGLFGRRAGADGGEGGRGGGDKLASS